MLGAEEPVAEGTEAGEYGEDLCKVRASAEEQEAGKPRNAPSSPRCVSSPPAPRGRRLPRCKRCGPWLQESASQSCAQKPDWRKLTESPLERPHAANLRNENAAEDDVLLLDAVVEQDAYSHQGRCARADLRVEQEDVARCGRLERRRQALRERDLVQERLAGLDVALDQDAADRYVPHDSSQALLERCAGPEDGDTAEVAVGNGELHANVLDACSGLDRLFAVGEEGEGVFDDEGGEAVGEEDEVFGIGFGRAEESMNAL